MKVLIVGGNRFFGRRLTMDLVDAGHDVWTLNRGSLPVTGAKSVIGDRRVEADLRRTIDESGSKSKKFDVVFDQVCMSYQDADLAMKWLAPYVEHWVHTSTQSVYDSGFEISEGAFNAASYNFEVSPVLPPYPEAKRQAEARLEQARKDGQIASLALMRIPIVLGPDDYTERLVWHVRRVQRGEPMTIPNKNARLNFISSIDAARALQHLGFPAREAGPGRQNRPLQGAFNCASRDPISVGQVIHLIEGAVGHAARLISEDHSEGDAIGAADEKTYSPFGVTSDWTMSTSKIETAGFTAAPLRSWLEPLIAELAKSKDER